MANPGEVEDTSACCIVAPPNADPIPPGDDGLCMDVYLDAVGH